jgi:hypothetical protein
MKTGTRCSRLKAAGCMGGVIEMSTPETLIDDALRDNPPLSELCPECLCRSIVVTTSLPANRIDPACDAGYCQCRTGEMVSLCCGKPAHADVEALCGWCLEPTDFERECPCTYEFG